MRLKMIGTATALSLFVGISAVPAAAQKSKDTLRMGYYDPISMVDSVFDPKTESGAGTRAVYDALILYDEVKHKLVPHLATSWKYIDPTTIEFVLRKDVKFSDGVPFTADDVVYTIDFLTDPKARFRLPNRIAWLAGAEKIDPYTVRIRTDAPNAVALLRLTRTIQMFPKHIHEPLEDKSTFGKNPVGSGPYRVASVSPDNGFVLVKNEAYHHGSSVKPAASIGRFHGRPIPDRQTQIAELLTGGLDLLYRNDKDQIAALKKDGRFAVTIQPGLGMYYMTIDAANRSGNKALSDNRVREAIWRAIDRDAIRNEIIPGADELPNADALCFPSQIACSTTVEPVTYDPAKAKKLLAEAGYPNGFDLEVTTNQPVALGEYIAGELRKVGIRANVSRLSMVAYRKKQGDGQLQMLVGGHGGSGLPDASGFLDFFFTPGQNDYWQDKVIHDALANGNSELDPDKRKEFFRQAFDQINREHYVLMLTPRPEVFIHTKDVRVGPQGGHDVGAFNVYDLHWN